MLPHAHAAAPRSGGTTTARQRAVGGHGAGSQRWAALTASCTGPPLLRSPPVGRAEVDADCRHVDGGVCASELLEGRTRGCLRKLRGTEAASSGHACTQASGAGVRARQASARPQRWGGAAAGESSRRGQQGRLRPAAQPGRCSPRARASGKAVPAVPRLQWHGQACARADPRALGDRSRVGRAAGAQGRPARETDAPGRAGAGCLARCWPEGGGALLVGCRCAGGGIGNAGARCRRAALDGRQKVLDEACPLSPGAASSFCARLPALAPACQID